jgi:hypothetical protein
MEEDDRRSAAIAGLADEDVEAIDRERAVRGHRSHLSERSATLPPCSCPVDVASSLVLTRLVAITPRDVAVMTRGLTEEARNEST